MCSDCLFACVQVFLLGCFGRLIGITVATLFTLPFQRPYRRRCTAIWQSIVFYWVCSLPKATVQAALGGLPLAQNIVEKPVGDYISSATAFAVLIFVPFGVLLTSLVARPLAEQLVQQERQAADERSPLAGNAPVTLDSAVPSISTHEPDHKYDAVRSVYVGPRHTRSASLPEFM